MKNLVGKLQDLYVENDRNFGRNKMKKGGNFRTMDDDFIPYKKNKKGRFVKFAK